MKTKLVENWKCMHASQNQEEPTKKKLRRERNTRHITTGPWNDMIIIYISLFYMLTCGPSKKYMKNERNNKKTKAQTHLYFSVYFWGWWWCFACWAFFLLHFSLKNLFMSNIMMNCVVVCALINSSSFVIHLCCVLNIFFGGGGGVDDWHGMHFLNFQQNLGVHYLHGFY